MNLFVYSDESGVFDNKHEKFFVFGGLILTNKNDKDILSRKYIKAEKCLRYKYPFTKELKATHISNSDKGKLFRSLNSCYKFAVVIRINEVNNKIFDHKKDKQRYLDYAYKIALKNALLDMEKKGLIQLSNVDNLYIFTDEHTTATNGLYELKESIEQEFKRGTFNYNYMIHYPPIIPRLQSVKLKYCNSETVTLVRAADIIANKVYYKAKKNKIEDIITEKFFVKYLP
ncbi:MAG: DUF3800 domain-containing protein [Oscillospiraceae bacterium]|nr:DUF3800 domain-containing protein [Oscillospiraceae bacterium]MBQ8377792.1 DUF3800 domain-containing protein [Oscillospiraceae bacterium]